jgi:hypothetical protein
VFIGLGKAAGIEKLEILWAGGSTETVTVPNVNRIISVLEGKTGLLK